MAEVKVQVIMGRLGRLVLGSMVQGSMADVDGLGTGIGWGSLVIHLWVASVLLFYGSS